MTATTALGQREAEARRIARVEGFPIIEASDDWTYFTLGDGQTIGPEGTNGRGLLAGRTIHTHFGWVEEPEDTGHMYGRFEGFVS